MFGPLTDPAQVDRTIRERMVDSAEASKQYHLEVVARTATNADVATPKTRSRLGVLNWIGATRRLVHLAG
jgi:hypothetical protein